MDFKQIDKHTPKYYWDQLGMGFKSEDPRTVSASLYGLLFQFSNDFNMLCPALGTSSRDFVREVVDYLDRKYTATIKYFRQQGLKVAIPDTGYRHSLLDSRPDIAAKYGPEILQGVGMPKFILPN